MLSPSMKSPQLTTSHPHQQISSHELDHYAAFTSFLLVFLLLPQWRCLLPSLNDYDLIASSWFSIPLCPLPQACRSFLLTTEHNPKWKSRPLTSCPQPPIRTFSFRQPFLQFFVVFFFLISLNNAQPSQVFNPGSASRSDFVFPGLANSFCSSSGVALSLSPGKVDCLIT